VIDLEADSGDYEESSNVDDDSGQPSLGYLDEALQFIAAERARLTAPRDNSWQRDSSTSDNPPQQQQLHLQQQHQQLHPRRKRRKRKARSLVRTIVVRDSGPPGDDNQSHTERLEGDDPSDQSSLDISSSGAAIRFRSTPFPSPRKAGRHNRVRSASLDGRPRLGLGHSRSTPSLRSGPLDPSVVRIRALATKLKLLFGAEAKLLTAVLSNDSLQSSSSDFIDPRGSTPTSGQPLVHVFVD
jgi:hypothetical protein